MATLLLKTIAAIVVAAAGFAIDQPSSIPERSNACSADDPALLMCDDFADSASLEQWDIGSHSRRWSPQDFVRCEPGFGYGDDCAAWSNRLIFDRSWGFWGYDARRVFLPRSELYVRWYQYIPDPYEWGTLEDKSVLLHDPANTITTLVGTNRNHLPSEPNSGPGLPFIANYQDLDWSEMAGDSTRVNRFQNQDRNIALQPGRWYLFEWYVRLNTPGESNGITKLWIDDATEPIAAQTLRLHYEDMRWLRSRDAGRQFGMIRLTLYHQRCDFPVNTCPPRGPEVLEQSHRWDSIVVSTNPIGPITRGGER
jgi:hypothetical protein